MLPSLISTLAFTHFGEGGHHRINSDTLIILALVGLVAWWFARPRYRYNRDWGNGPHIGVGFVVVVIIVMWILGVI